MSMPVALPPDFALPLLGYVLLANLLALGLFALGRAVSPDGEWGGAETRTLFLSMMGGWLGAKLGQLMFRRGPAPQGFGLMLNLSILVLPVVIAVPFLIQAAPAWVAQGYDSYVASYAASQAQPAVPGDATGTVAAEADSPDAALADAAGDAVGAVESAATTEARDAALPKRFGPTTAPKGHKAQGHKILSVSGN